MKIKLTTLLAVIALTTFTQADELPKAAKEILEKLAEYEERTLKSTEEEIIKKKKEMISDLERTAKRIKSKGIKRLYRKQIARLEKEIKRSERTINGEEENKIVDFNVVYHYQHPMDEFSEQKGELIFFSNRSVKLRHTDDKGNTLFEHVIKWEERKGELVIIDEVHGAIIVNRKDRDELSLKWTRLDKTIPAKVR